LDASDSKNESSFGKDKYLTGPFKIINDVLEKFNIPKELVHLKTESFEDMINQSPQKLEKQEDQITEQEIKKL